MSLPEAEVARVAAYCEQASPDEFADQSRVEWIVDGASLTIIEASRLDADRDEDWLRVPCARLNHDPATNLWSLVCFDADSRAMPYDEWEPDFAQPTTVEAILAEIEADPTNIFWG